MRPGRKEGQRVEALARGLTVLRSLVDAGRPLSATAIAREMGLHQSSVSRLLATLADTGFVRKTAAGFTPDFGVLSLASSIEQFPLIDRPRAAMQRIGEQAGGLNVSLGMLWPTDDLLPAQAGLRRDDRLLVVQLPDPGLGSGHAATPRPAGGRRTGDLADVPGAVRMVRQPRCAAGDRRSWARRSAGAHRARCPGAPRLAQPRRDGCRHTYPRG